METVNEFRSEVSKSNSSNIFFLKSCGLVPRQAINLVEIIIFPYTDLQLNAVLNNKLPVSRAKMASITKLAIKSIKV